MAIITLKYNLINNGDAVRILCNQAVYSGVKNIVAKPNANIDGPVEAQTQSFENPKIVLQGVKFNTGYTPPDARPTERALTWDDVLELYTHKYVGSNTITLNVKYGPNTDEVDLEGLTGTDIQVVMTSFNFPIDTTASKDGYLPTGTLSFTETN